MKTDIKNEFGEGMVTTVERGILRAGHCFLIIADKEAKVLNLNAHISSLIRMEF